jgi:hypothetical protein
MRNVSFVFLILLLYMGFTTLVDAQAGYEVRLTQVIRVSGKLDVDVEIRSTAATSVLATSTFVFNYNGAALGSPAKVASNDGPWSSGDRDYQAVALSHGNGYAGLAVVCVGGDDNNGAVVPSTFTRIGTIQFTIVDPSQTSDLAWRSIGRVTEVSELSDPGINASQELITSSSTFADPINGPLPIQLASFGASVVRDNDVEITWKTVSETNNYGFEVYRRRASGDSTADSSQSRKIGFVKGHGTTLAPQSYTLVDQSLGFGKYFYQVRQLDLDGNSKVYPETDVTVGATPGKFVLAQNYPNPFNPKTTIEFAVPENGPATMKVYDVLGQQVTTLFQGKAETGKIYYSYFDASNFASGVYFYTLRSSGKAETKRMIVLK